MAGPVSSRKLIMRCPEGRRHSGVAELPEALLNVEPVVGALEQLQNAETA